jgi:YD repeat-containing protein
MTSDGVNTYVFTFGNRLVSATRAGMTATYDYDSDDRRTRKTVNGVVTRTMWSGKRGHAPFFLATLDRAGSHSADCQHILGHQPADFAG